MPKLTKRTVDAFLATINEREQFAWDEGDGSLKGFGVRLQPSGIASFLVQYRNQEGRTRRMVIGRVGVLTAEKAREDAREKLARIAGGGDPSAERQAFRDEITIAEVCDLFLQDARGRIKESTWEADKRRIECHIKPLLGQRAAKRLTWTDFEKFHADVAAGKTARPKRADGRGASAKGGPIAANRTLATASTIMAWAKKRNIVEANPVTGIRKFKDVKNERFLSTDEIRALGKAMRESETENPTGIAAIKALLLTGCRRNEILSLPKEWFDAHSRCIRFGDTKTGKQLRPLGDAAIKLLTAQCERSDSDWAFPADRGNGHFIGLPRVFSRLCEKANILGAHIHALRHTFASKAAELNFSQLTIAGLLGHTLPGVTMRYSHLPDSALTGAADRVAAFIATELDGKGITAEVMPLRKGKRQ